MENKKVHKMFWENMFLNIVKSYNFSILYSSRYEVQFNITLQKNLTEQHFMVHLINRLTTVDIV
ncbi:CLUMA_CG000526, isoform A [Clunio marinus]|uniref:CLUMA_CG000526, isoform A n=1 Tax=Clunio marinus TaxID=568069 RepID=A0A1J1HFA5_9DIPT|nr:CLUMA_CG000526, isoform A [Clunio marinus]